MKTFLQLQSTIPTYSVICEALTVADCKIVFEFKVEALNEKSADEKAEQVIKDLNLKNVVKQYKKL